MVGGVGVGTLVMKNNIELNGRRLLAYSFIGLALSSPVIVISFFFFFDSSSIIAAVLLSFSLTLNQIYRNEIIINKKFSLGSIYESLLIIIVMISCYTNQNTLMNISLGYVFVTFLIKYLDKVTISNESINIVESIYIGYSNLISTGILFFLPIISNNLFSPDLSAEISLIVSTVGLISVFPRAIFNLKLREMKDSLFGRDIVTYNNFIKDFRVKTLYIVIASSLAVYIYCYLVLDSNDPFQLFVLVLSISTFVCIGQISIPESTMINMIGHGKLSLLINLFIFISFCLTYFLIKYEFFISDLSSFIAVTQVVSVGYAVRMFIIKIKISGFV